jgi:DNA-binding NarL/FixJ family response regulator
MMLFNGVASTSLGRAATMPRATSETLTNLTPRQREIAGLISQGFTNKQIAQSLSLQEPTVKNHVHEVLRKLGLRRRGELLLRPSSSLLVGLHGTGLSPGQAD